MEIPYSYVDLNLNLLRIKKNAIVRFYLFIRSSIFSVFLK